MTAGFKLAMEDEPSKRPGFEMVHTDRIALVDRAGRVRDYVRGTDAEQVATVPAKVRALLAE